MRRVLVREKRYRDKLEAARLEKSPALGSSGRDRKIE
jgi:hypothetical protein